MTAQEEGRSKEDFASLQGGDWFILVAVLMLTGFSKATGVPLASYYLAWPKQVSRPRQVPAHICKLQAVTVAASEDRQEDQVHVRGGDGAEHGTALSGITHSQRDFLCSKWHLSACLKKHSQLAIWPVVPLSTLLPQMPPLQKMHKFHLSFCKELAIGASNMRG